MKDKLIKPCISYIPDIFLIISTECILGASIQIGTSFCPGCSISDLAPC